MTVAAIIINYNAGEWLQRSVKSVLAEEKIQTLFVVDNCSKDNSIDQLTDSFSTEEFPKERLNILRNKQNLGFGKANNQALKVILEQQEIDYVLLINPDCELTEGVVEKMLPYFESSKAIGMAGCVITNSDGTVQITCRRRFPTPLSAFLRITQLSRFNFIKNRVDQSEFDLGAEPLPKSMVKVDAVSGAFMLVRKEAIEDVGLFDEAYFMHCEDLDWCKRFAISGWDIAFIPEVSVVHEKGISSQTRPIGVLWNLHQGMLRFFDKFYRNSYSWPLRLIVRIGIYANFIVRAAGSVVKQVATKLFGK